MKKILATTAILSTLMLGSVAIAGDHEQCKYKHKGEHVKEMLADLPAEKAELIKSFMQEMKEGRKEKWAAMKANRDEMRNLLTAEDFDKGAFISKALEIDALHSKAKLKMSEKVADLAGKLSLEEREVLAKVIERKMKHRHQKHGKHKGHSE